MTTRGVSEGWLLRKWRILWTLVPSWHAAVACGHWLVAFPTGLGLCPLASPRRWRLGPLPLAPSLWPLTFGHLLAFGLVWWPWPSGLWHVAAGRWALASGLWLAWPVAFAVGLGPLAVGPR